MDKELRPVEIKDLNKTQLILLALLLSFVTSIATGIVTVTLMQQASPKTTQTINRVVQQTIEKVVPDYSPSTTQTVVVKEDDLVVDAVQKTRANIGSVFADNDATVSLGDSYSLGSGVFLTTAPIDTTKTYTVKEGTLTLGVKVSATSPFGFSLLSVSDPTADVKEFPSPSFGNFADVKPGQTAVIVSSSDIQKSIVQSIVSASTDGTVPDTIMLDPMPSASSVGALVVDLDGDLVGVVVKSGNGETSIVGIGTVSAFITHPLSNMTILPSSASSPETATQTQVASPTTAS